MNFLLDMTEDSQNDSTIPRSTYGNVNGYNIGDAINDLMDSQDPIQRIMARAVALETMDDTPARQVLFGALELQVIRQIDRLSKSDDFSDKNSQYLDALEDLADTFRRKSGNYFGDSLDHSEYE